MSINQISQQTKNSIRENGVMSLPNNPSASGLSPAQIKQKLYNAIDGGVDNIIAEINRIVSEVNAEITSASSSANNYTDSKLNEVNTEDREALEDFENRIGTAEEDISTLQEHKYATSIDVDYNQTNGIITITLKDQDGNSLGVQRTIDLPIEMLVESASYNSIDKKIIFTLKNGESLEINVADLVDTYTAEGTYLVLSNNVFDLSETAKTKIEKAHDHSNKTFLDTLNGSDIAEAEEVEVDDVPIQGSTNFVKSGGVYSAINTPKVSISNYEILTSAWASDITYSDYPYRASIVNANVTSLMFPSVSFPNDVNKYSNICESFDGGIYVYATAIPSASVIVNALCVK